MYRVVETFADAQDRYYVYNVGDSFPRNGKTVSAERVNELLTNKNAIGKPIIVDESERPVVETKKKSKKK
jgi:hypothetical protein